MVTRRQILLSAAGALAARAGALPPSEVAFDVPRGACDCHTHVFGDPARFPFWSGRTYTPAPALVDQLRALHQTLHLERVVIVQPSVYGTDNRCTLDAIARLGRKARGVAVIGEDASDKQLDALHDAGIRGIRLNLETFGLTDPTLVRQRFQSAARRVAGRGWHVQINTRPSVIQALEEEVTTAPVPVVFDHFGGARAASGVEEPGFRSLVNLVRLGRAYVKISAAYLASNRAPDYPDVIPLARALIAANSERILWGSNWPHPNSATAPGRKATDVVHGLDVDDVGVFNRLGVWAPDERMRQTILVDNPARLYGF